MDLPPNKMLEQFHLEIPPNPFPRSADTSCAGVRRRAWGPFASSAQLLTTEDAMDGINGAGTQQIFGLAVQKSALDTQASMVSKLMEGASAGMQQPSQPEVGLRVDALGERGIGTQLSVVA
jgi:hypothetical protein